MDKETVALVERAIKALADIAEKHGPAALDLALAATRWEAGFKIASAGLVLAGCGVGMKLAWRLAKYAFAQPMDQNGWMEDRNIGLTGASVVAAVVMMVMAGFQIATMVSPALWLAVFDPRMAMAARVLGLR